MFVYRYTNFLACSTIVIMCCYTILMMLVFVTFTINPVTWAIWYIVVMAQIEYDELNWPLEKVYWEIGDYGT